MKRFFDVRGAAWIACAVLIPLLCGCEHQTGTATFLDFVQTVFLGVTAAGAVVIIQEI